MSDIVETIQAEQDHIIRSGLDGVLVVQGGPGTGKTAVALHRAAFLLYTYRRQLEKRGVLVVGPNATFLRYIGQVLPSLGETSVLLSTVGDLFPGVSATGTEPPQTAEIKGRRPWPRWWPPPCATASRCPASPWRSSPTTRSSRWPPGPSAGPGSGPAGPGGRTTWPGPCSPARSSPR